MRICAYPRCRHRDKGNDCRLHKLPSSPRVAVGWMKACHWMGSPQKVPPATYICSCHFNDGQGPSKDCRVPDPCKDDIPWIAVIAGRRGSIRGKDMTIPKKKKASSESTQEKALSPVLTPECTIQSGPTRDATSADVTSSGAQKTHVTCTTEQNPLNAAGRIEEEREDDPAVIHEVTSEALSPIDISVKTSFYGAPKTRVTCTTEQNPLNVAGRIEEEREDDPAVVHKVTSEALSPIDVSVKTTSYDTNPSERKSSFSMNRMLEAYGDLAAPLDEDDATAVQSGDSVFRLPRPWGKTSHEDIPDNRGPERRSGFAVATHSTGLQTDLPLFSYEGCRRWEECEFKHLTGIDLASFEILYDLLGGDEVCSKLKYKFNQKTPRRRTDTIHSPKDCLFLTLVRLRRNFKIFDMQFFFNLHESWVSRIFTAWIKLMSNKFKSMEDAIFVSVAAQQANTPDCYKPFPNLRCVIDAFEVFIQKPQNMEQQSNTFSTYKKRNTAKVLVASSVYGGVSFVSQAMEGSASDRKIFMRSGILRHLNRGEAIMADRGFDVEPELNEIGVDLIIPPFLGNREAFTSRELMVQKSVAVSRSHVETVIGRIENFNMIGETYPNTMLDILSDVVRVAANLVNFSDPFIRWDQKKKQWVPTDR